MRTLLLLLVLLYSTCILPAQRVQLRVPPSIQTLRDSVMTKKLIVGINTLLEQVLGPDSIPCTVYDSTVLDNRVLFSEMRGIAKSAKYNDEHFYKPYLANMTQQGDSSYRVQLHFIGIHDTMALLRASYTIDVHVTSDQIRFRSPFATATLDWKQLQIGSFCFHYRNRLNEEEARKYCSTIAAYDTKLGASTSTTDLYCCADLSEALRFCGVDYKSDYSGRTRSSASEELAGRELVLNGICGVEFGPVDPHDLWHARRSRVIPTEKTNKPVEEGFAFIYAGSWGISWPTILDSFKLFAKQHPDADWLWHYNQRTNIASKGGFPLYLDYLINALVVQDIESTKGFAVARELLLCGPYQKGNANYFAALQRLHGVSESEFHHYVQRLLQKN